MMYVANMQNVNEKVFVVCATQVIKSDKYYSFETCIVHFAEITFESFSCSL
jgi:hypothetical protein